MSGVNKYSRKEKEETRILNVEIFFCDEGNAG